MRLRAYDTVHVSAVRADNLRPGEEFEVGDALGAELMKMHPKLFAQVDGGTGKKAEPAPRNKVEPEPENKAPMAAPSRRSVPRQ